MNCRSSLSSSIGSRAGTSSPSSRCRSRRWPPESPPAATCPAPPRTTDVGDQEVLGDLDRQGRRGAGRVWPAPTRSGRADSSPSDGAKRFTAKGTSEARPPTRGISPRASMTVGQRAHESVLAGERQELAGRASPTADAANGAAPHARRPGRQGELRLVDQLRAALVDCTAELGEELNSVRGRPREPSCPVLGGSALADVEPHLRR